MSQIISFTDYTPAPRYDSTAWSSVEVYEASTSEGTWTLIDTIALSPVDADPTTPASRSFTTDQASDSSGLWYRIRFIDGSGGVGLYSAAVQNVAPGEESFASADDLAARLGITLTEDEGSRALSLLGQASDLVRQAAKQHISRVTDDVLVIPGRWDDRILLPELPVISVASVTATFYNGSPYTLPTDSWYVDRDELVRYAFPVGLQRHFFTTGQGWLGPGYTLTITYTHGYESAPAIARQVAVEAAARVWNNPSGAGQVGIAGAQMTFADVGMMLTEDEEEDIADAFRRQSHSIRLR